MTFETWDPSDIWSEWCVDKQTKRQKRQKRQKDKKRQQESLILRCQGSFALLRCFPIEAQISWHVIIIDNHSNDDGGGVAKFAAVSCFVNNEPISTLSQCTQVAFRTFLQKLIFSRYILTFFSLPRRYSMSKMSRLQMFWNTPHLQMFKERAAGKSKPLCHKFN